LAQLDKEGHYIAKGGFNGYNLALFTSGGDAQDIN
jgi:hypothetical protein